MIRIIETDLGNYDKFIDVYKDMKYLKCNQVEIKSIRLWDGNFLMIKGKYSLDEIEFIVKGE